MDITSIALALSMAANVTAILAGLWGLYKLLTSRRHRRPLEPPIIVIVLAVGVGAFGPAAYYLVGASLAEIAVGQVILLPALLGAAAFVEFSDISLRARPLDTLVGRGATIVLRQRRGDPPKPVEVRGRILAADESSVVLAATLRNEAISRRTPILIIPRSDIQVIEVGPLGLRRIITESDSPGAIEQPGGTEYIE
jgi:hypothetical protein